MLLVNVLLWRNDAEMGKVLRNFILFALPLAALVSCSSTRGHFSREVRSNQDEHSEAMSFEPSTLSPDGKILYFTWSISGRPQVWKLEGPMLFPQQLTTSSEANSVWATTPDGKSLIVLRSSLGRPASRSVIVVLSNDGEAKISDNCSGDQNPFWVTNDNTRIFYLCYDETSGRSAIFSYVFETRRSEMFLSESGRWSIADVQNDQSFLLAQSTGENEVRYFQWSPNEKVPNPINSLPEIRDLKIRFARNQGEYLIFDSNQSRFFVFKGGHATPLELTPAVTGHIRSFTMDHRRLHLYLGMVDEAPRVFDLHFESSTAIRVQPREFPALNPSFVVQTSRYDRFVTLNAVSANFVQIIYDWKENKATQWLPAMSLALPPKP